MSRPVRSAREGQECSECRTLFSASDPNWYVLGSEWLHVCWLSPGGSVVPSALWFNEDPAELERRRQSVRGRAVPVQKEDGS